MSLTQDRIPGIHQVIDDFHNKFNNLQSRWNGMGGMPAGHAEWPGLFIPDLTTSDPRSYQNHLEYMDWVLEQNFHKYAKELGWQGEGYAIDFLRNEPLETSSLSLSVSGVGVPISDKEEVPLDATVKSVLDDEVPAGNKLVGDKNQPGDVEADVSDAGVYSWLDKFFVWLNSLFKGK